MSGILIRHFIVPPNCIECEWRDAEAGGDCELMIRNPFKTYTEQYKHCPFQVISKRYSLVPVPPHGRLIDADALHEELYALEYVRENEWLDGVREARGVDAARVALLDAPTIIEEER